MRALILIILAGLISACASPAKFTSPQPGVDDLPIEKTIRIVRYQSRFDGIGGFAIYVPGSKVCEIAILRPTSPDDSQAFCTLGHEIWHCLTGHYHVPGRSGCGL